MGEKEDEVITKATGPNEIFEEEKKDPRSRTEDQGWEISLAGTDSPCRYSDSPCWTKRVNLKGEKLVTQKGCCSDSKKGTEEANENTEYDSKENVTRRGWRKLTRMTASWPYLFSTEENCVSPRSVCSLGSISVRFCGRI